MIIGATHWLLALGIATSIHLAGMWWLSLPVPAPPPVIDPAGDSIVVTLGGDPRRAEARGLPPQDGPPETVSDVVETEVPETLHGTSPAAVPEVESTPAVVDLETVDSAAPPEPAQVAEAAAPELNPVEPESALSEPPTVDASEVKPATIESTVRELAEAEPPGTELPETQPAETQSPEGSLRPPLVVIENRVAAEPSVGVAVEVAGDAPVPESTASTVTVEPVTPVAGAGLVASPSVEPVPVQQTPDATTVERAGEVQIDGPVQKAEWAKVRSAGQPEIEIAAARPTLPPVEQVSEPAVSEAPQPKLIDLQALQESSGGRGVAARYAGTLKGWLQKNMHYPRAARLAGQEGQVVVRFIIDRGGDVLSIDIESKSGFPLLDREAREMIERGDPFPRMPDDMPGQQLEVRVPVSFHVHDETLTKEIPPIYLK